MMFPRAIVLAGGASTRFGSDKALANVAGRTLTALCVSRLLEVFKQVFVVAKQPGQLDVRAGERVRLIHDGFADYASLVGLFEGLRRSDRTLNYVTGCDMPGVVPELIELQYRLARGTDCALRCDQAGRAQPFGGFYSKKALPVLERFVREKHFKMADVLAELDVRTIPFDTVASLDPDLRSFWNVNTPADLDRILTLLDR